MLEQLNSTDFRTYLQQRFDICPEALEKLPAELIEVTEWGPSQIEYRQPFSLIFRGPQFPILPQQIYAVEHETLGAMDIFLVPIGPDDSGMRYQAIFS